MKVNESARDNGSLLQVTFNEKSGANLNAVLHAPPAVHQVDESNESFASYSNVLSDQQFQQWHQTVLQQQLIDA